MGIYHLYKDKIKYLLKKGALRTYEKRHDKKAFKKNGKLNLTELKK